MSPRAVVLGDRDGADLALTTDGRTAFQTQSVGRTAFGTGYLNDSE